MSRNSGFLEVSASPFEIYESNDLDWETPKSSHHQVKRSCSRMEKRDVKIKSWSQLFLTNYSNQLSGQSIKTPMTGKLGSNEPLAPMKHRRSINKSELKPKKLIFKDLEDYESGIVGLFSPLTLKINKKIMVRSDDQSTSETLTKERKQKSKESGRSKVNIQPPSNDKENRCENQRNKNKDMRKQLKEHLKTNPNDKSSFKHLRI